MDNPNEVESTETEYYFGSIQEIDLIDDFVYCLEDFEEFKLYAYSIT